MLPTAPVESPSSKQSVRFRLIAAGLVSVVVFVVLYGLFNYTTGYGQHRVSIFNQVYAQWGLEDWGHCIMVPFAVALIVFLERAKLTAIPLAGAGSGFWILCCGLFLYWLGFKADNIYFSYAAAQILLAGFIVWFGGWAWMRALFFPWLFLIFMWPLLFLENFISFPLRMMVSHAGVLILNLVGIPSILNGTGILSAADPLRHLAQGELFAVDVALPCSGMRSLFALLMVSSLYGYFTISGALGRLTLFLTSIPLAIAGNICRIVMLTVGTMVMGSERAIGSLEHPSFFHMLAGYVVFLVALGGMILVSSLINRCVSRSQLTEKTLEKPLVRPSSPKTSGDLF
jgi:exosortase